MQRGSKLKRILIQFDEFSLQARLNDTPTVEELWKQLPLESQVNTWGDEIYFEIPVDMPQELDAREILVVGELGYWPVGKSFCIFFGPTPVSTDQRPRAFSPVNILGEIVGNSQGLRAIKDHDKVKLLRSDEE
jgi:hypothetical protein